VVELQPLERAVLPEAPASPVPSRDIPVGAGLGLALGILLAFAIEYLRTPRRVENEPQIRSLVPNGISTITPITQVPALQQPFAREEMKVINGGQAQAPPRQEYLVPGRQQRIGWQDTPNTQPERALQSGHREDSYPG
jgi:hypothetical protein